MRFIVFEDVAGGWRWRLVAGNGEIVATGAEGYSRARDVHRAIRTFRGAIWRAPIQGKLVP